MSLYHRLRRRLGRDTTKMVTERRPRYEYEIDHGDHVGILQAHYHITRDGIVRFEEYGDPHQYYNGFVFQKEEMVNRIGTGTIVSMDRDCIGYDVWNLLVDRADSTITDWNHYFEEAT